MAKNYLRKIVIDGETYLWYRVHFHSQTCRLLPCVEILTVFSQHAKRNPLRIYFKGDDNEDRDSLVDSWQCGYPETGVLWLRDSNGDCALRLNLNRPKVIAALIRLARMTGWNPVEAQSPHIVEHGLRFLDEHFLTLQESIDPTGSEATQDTDYFSPQTGGIYRYGGH